MAFKLADGVWETSTTPGTGAVTLAGAKQGYTTFAAGIGTGNSTFYCLRDADQFEVGIGTLTVGTSTTLSRDTVLANSAGTTSRISWGAGTRDVFIYLPAARAAVLSAINIWLADQKLRSAKLFFDTPDTSWAASGADNQISFYLQSAEFLRLDGPNQRASVISAGSGSAEGPDLRIARLSPAPANLDSLGVLRWTGNDSALTEVGYAKIRVQAVVKTANAQKGHMDFEVANGTGNLIDVFHLETGVAYLGSNTKFLTGGKSSSNAGTVGCELWETGQAFLTQSGVTGITLNRLVSDGTLIDFQRAGVSQGSISVSGTTVTYANFCGVHATALVGSDLAGLPEGTVLESVDELLEGFDQLVKAAVAQPRSDRVYGVVCPSEGDKPTAAGVGAYRALVRGPIRGGDLLWVSDEPGIAERQPDRFVQSWTLGKVTMGDDRTDVRLVPCVLYAG